MNTPSQLFPDIRCQNRVILQPIFNRFQSITRRKKGPETEPKPRPAPSASTMEQKEILKMLANHASVVDTSSKELQSLHCHHSLQWLRSIQDNQSPMRRKIGDCRSCRSRPLRSVDPRPFTVAVLSTLTVLMILALVVFAAL